MDFFKAQEDLTSYNSGLGLLQEHRHDDATDDHLLLLHGYEVMGMMLDMVVDMMLDQPGLLHHSTGPPQASAWQQARHDPGLDPLHSSQHGRIALDQALSGSYPKTIREGSQAIPPSLPMCTLRKQAAYPCLQGGRRG